MRRTILFCVVIAFAIACGDNITEPVPDRTPSTPTVAFATTTTEDGLSISTDKDDYQPGDVVHFTGYGWQPFDVLDIVLTDNPETDPPHTWTVNVGVDGMFHDSTYVVDEGDINVAFTLVATSRASGRSLTVQFTDNIVGLQVSLNNLTAVTVAPGATISLSISARVNLQGNNQAPTSWRSTGWVLLPNPATVEPTGQLANCVNTNDVAGSSGNGTPGNAAFSITAPTNAGRYDLWIALSDVDGTGPTACGGGGLTEKQRFINVVTVVVVDQTRPSVTINQAQGQLDPTNSSPINFTVVFSEPVADFAAADVTLGGAGAAGATAAVTGSGSTYNVAVSGMTTTGPVSASLGQNVAHDAAGNGNEASSSTDNTVLYDKTGPQVTINQKSDQPNLTNQSPIHFTVIFDKPVTDFTGTDVTLGGTAHPTTAVVSGGSDGMNWEVAVSGMTDDGTVTATIAADVAHDAIGNGNMAASSTDNEVTYDATPPTVTINQATAQADPTNTSPINFTVIFSEPVSGFLNNDILLSGTAHPTTAAVSTTDPDLKIYNVAVSGMTGDGTVIASVRALAAADEATNNSAASTSTDNAVTYDKTPPDVTINQKTGQADPTSTLPINFTVEFTENVAGFATGDVTLSGTAGLAGAIATVTASSGTTYNVAVSGVTTGGTVIASIGAGKATDVSGNGNTASTSTDHTVSYDPEPPVVSNVAVSPNPTNGLIEVSAKATVDDQASGGSTIVAAYYNIDGGATLYQMTADDGHFDQPSEDVTGTISLTTLAGLSPGSHTICVQGKDAAGNTSLFSATGACTTLTIDRAPPVVSDVKVSPNLTNGTIDVIATAKVSDVNSGNSKIAAASYTIDAGDPIPMTAYDGSFSSAYEKVTATIAAATVHALSEAPHEICVQGKDAAGNASDFEDACTTLTVDKTPPKVTINQAGSQIDPTNGSTINFTVVFSEIVSDFATGDVTLAGTAGATTATVSGSGTSYNVAVTGMTTDGTVIASINADVAHDGATNGNEASTSDDNTVTYDKTPPEIACGTADGLWHNADVSISCTASDATSGLKYAADASFTLITSVAAGTETSNASTNSKSIADRAGNVATAGSIAGNQVDKKAPVVSCGTADGAWHAADVSIACTAADGGSGLASPGDAAFTLTTNVTAGTEPNNALTNTHDVADAVGNKETAGPIGGNKVDKKAPVVTLTCPLTPVILNASTTASWTATDGGSGVPAAYASGTIPLDASSAGPKTATAGPGTAKDNVNNPSAAASCTYSVSYVFSGLFAPVDQPNTMNLSKAGQAVPLKWRLTDANGAPVLNFTAAALGVAVTGMVCTVNATLDQIEEYTGNSGLQNLGDGYYQFNWKTPTSYANSCKAVGLNLGEGTPRGPLAYFNFKK